MLELNSANHPAIIMAKQVSKGLHTLLHIDGLTHIRTHAHIHAHMHTHKHTYTHADMHTPRRFVPMLPVARLVINALGTR